MALELNISGVYLSLLCKKELGQTFLEYLTQYRIKVAKQLIQTTDYKVYEIARLVGYKSAQYFSQIFKTYTNKTPLEFKEKGEKYEKND